MSSVKSDSDGWVTPVSKKKKKKNKAEAYLFDRVEPRHQPDTHRWEIGGSDRTMCSEETPSPSSNPLEAKGRSVRGRKPGDPTYLVETTRASHLPRNQDVMPSTPNPEKEEEGGMISSDADIPDSIARAVLGALQEKRTGNDLLSTIISIARVRASQLQQCLSTGREPSKGTIQATLDLISLGQEPSGRTNLADKVSTVSYTRVYFESTEYHYCTCTDKQQ